jgi:hypothetical protein
MPSYTKTVKVPGKTSQELYEKVAQEIDRFLSKTMIGKYDLERDPGAKEVRFAASMASATLRCGEGELVLEAKLSLMAMPFRSKLDDAIDRWVAKTFV